MGTFELDFLLHGADYNYEQWLDYPEILAEDFRLMKLAKCNVMSVGIFSWAMLEPAEGKYQFDWLDQLMDRLAANGMKALLATPSGGKPAWMAEKYPEIRLVDENGRISPHRLRHNHCPTSPIYREKVEQINTLLAKRYQHHPALLMWHVSNEYGNHNCRCPKCIKAFQMWLQQRYGSLDTLNHAWWTTFWSHRYTDWSQIRPVDPSMHGLMLDWMRFVSDQVQDFYLAEIRPLRTITPSVPITTNFMQPDVGLDYWAFAKHIDMVSWDSYPRWHIQPDEQTISVQTAFYHDLHRSYKKRPFLLIESTPSVTNWQSLSRPKRPGMHKLSSLQAVAHGANSVQYFQWRQSRGGEEKFHGAVVSHIGQEKTRVFRDVTAVGDLLAQLPHVAQNHNRAEVGLIYDFQNEWILNLVQLPRNEEKCYQQRCMAHYQPFWQTGITVDMLDSSSQDLSDYKLIIAPMLYMLRDDIQYRLTEFVQQGGTLVMTYLSGMVNESDLCFIGESPLQSLLGLWVEETDTLYSHNKQTITAVSNNHLSLQGSYPVTHYADVLHLETAQPLALYDHDFYAGQPALTVNQVGNGRVYYIAARPEPEFLSDFYGALQSQLQLKSALSTPLPEGVTAQIRQNGNQKVLFLMNFNAIPQTVDLGYTQYTDAVTSADVSGTIELNKYEVRILQTEIAPER